VTLSRASKKTAELKARVEARVAEIAQESRSAAASAVAGSKFNEPHGRSQGVFEAAELKGARRGRRRDLAAAPNFIVTRAARPATTSSHSSSSVQREVRARDGACSSWSFRWWAEP